MSKSRWVPLRATSNSGKTLFVCTDCGRVSTTPDKRCGRPYFTAMGGEPRLVNCGSDEHTRYSWEPLRDGFPSHDGVYLFWTQESRPIMALHFMPSISAGTHKAVYCVDGIPVPIVDTERLSLESIK